MNRIINKIKFRLKDFICGFFYNYFIRKNLKFFLDLSVHQSILEALPFNLSSTNTKYKLPNDESVLIIAPHPDDEVIGLEKNYKMYSSERQKYKNLLSMTNFYIGIAFVNSGNIPKGAFYLTLASRSASSQAQSDYYDSFIEQISSYL